MTTTAVFIGSSNSQPGTWPELLCQHQGWVCKNFSIGGGGYAETSPSSFLNQLRNAIAGTDNTAVDFVFVTDASNDIRGGRPVQTPASQVFREAVTAFPNARVIVVPVLWNHSQANIENLDRRLGVSQRAGELREAALPYGVEVIEWSWLWHWNSTEWDDAVHFTPNGYLRVALFIGRYLRGIPTDSPKGWTQLTPVSANVTVWPVRAKRDGNLVSVQGWLKVWGSVGIDTDLGKFGVGLHPVDTLQVDLIGSDRAHYTGTIYPEGTFRSLSPLPAQTYWINAAFATL